MKAKFETLPYVQKQAYALTLLLISCIGGLWGCETASGDSSKVLPYSSEGVVVTAPTIAPANKLAEGEATTEVKLDKPPHPLFTCAPKAPFRIGIRLNAGDSALVYFIVDERGLVEKAKVKSESAADFGEEAVRAVLKWRFEPMTRAGKPVEVELSELFYTGYPPDMMTPIQLPSDAPIP